MQGYVVHHWKYKYVNPLNGEKVKIFHWFWTLKSSSGKSSKYGGHIPTTAGKNGEEVILSM